MDWSIIDALIRSVESKDRSTAAHTWRVTLYTQAFAEAGDATQDEVRRLMRAAVLHDIGKIDMPDAILGKPGPLTADEVEVMRRHTVLGYERLLRMGERDPAVLSLVRWHHERLDGSGYPDALLGEEIPAVARTFAVIDTFDALTSLRPYRRLVGRTAALHAVAELRRQAGVWYCPQTVDRFTELVESRQLDWILHHLNDESALPPLPAVPDPNAMAAARRAIVSPDENEPPEPSNGR